MKNEENLSEQIETGLSYISLFEESVAVYTLKVEVTFKNIQKKIVVISLSMETQSLNWIINLYIHISFTLKKVFSMTRIHTQSSILDQNYVHS
jgi:hypothetical protein